MSDDNDLDLDDDTDPLDDDGGAGSGAPADPPAPAAAQPPADPPAAKPDDQTKHLAELGLAALKQSFVEAAKAAGHVAADFDSIGLKGIDEAAKAAFIAEAQASHAGRVEALKAQGFVFNPQAAQVADQQAQLDAQDAAQAAAWGKPGPGMGATGDEKFTAQVADEVKRGDTVGVIGSLLGEGGLGKFFVTGKR